MNDLITIDDKVYMVTHITEVPFYTDAKMIAYTIYDMDETRPADDDKYVPGADEIKGEWKRGA